MALKSSHALDEPSYTPMASRVPLVITFDMRSTLDDLFGHLTDDSLYENKMNQSTQLVSEIIDRNEVEFKEPLFIPIDSPLLKKPKSRRLRFDEASIIETKCLNDTANKKKSNVENDDDSFESIQTKPIKKKSKRLNWSSSDGESMKNDSTDAEFDDIIGNNKNFMDEYADDFEYLDDDANEDDSTDESKIKRTRRKKTSKLILDEADESDQDRIDDEDDEENDEENEDQYDLKDSFVDTNDYSHDNGNFLFFFRAFLLIMKK
jgi:hypothetical protein